MSESEIQYDSDKIHVHRWPRDSPIWDESAQKEIDNSLNKNPNPIPATFKENTIVLGNVEFYSLKKIGETSFEIPLNTRVKEVYTSGKKVHQDLHRHFRQSDI